MVVMARVGEDVIDRDLSFVSGWAATRSKSIPALTVAKVHAGSWILCVWSLDCGTEELLDCTLETLVTHVLITDINIQVVLTCYLNYFGIDLGCILTKLESELAFNYVTFRSEF